MKPSRRRSLSSSSFPTPIITIVILLLCLLLHEIRRAFARAFIQSNFFQQIFPSLEELFVLHLCHVVVVSLRLLRLLSSSSFFGRGGGGGRIRGGRRSSRFFALRRRRRGFRGGRFIISPPFSFCHFRCALSAVLFVSLSRLVVSLFERTCFDAQSEREIAFYAGVLCGFCA